MAEAVDYQARLKQALAAMQKMRARLDALEQRRSEPIAVIGIGCRFPGGVRGPEAYWRLLHEGVDAIREVPAGRWDTDHFYDPDPSVPGKMYVRHGGFLDDLDQFDPQFFGIAPREASSMDPQQRLFLEVAWEALEHANLPPEKLAGTQTGVFVGITASDYMQLHARYMDPADINAYLASGNVPNVTAGRLSYLLGLHGPSMALDTACSSSLTAIHMACQSIRSGESTMAIAGGVNVMLVPEIMVSFSKWGMLSPSGRCKTFDAAADGFVRGEGCGVVILKPLSAAVADGDNILAVIRGSAANQDGASSGLSVPNGLAQAAVIRQALANAGVDPHAIRYVEAHGTGTTLGDPIEVEALGEVLCRQRPADQPLAIGSVKTNIGHLEAASGVAGLIKTVLALYHEEIPPHLHLQERSPHINWADLPIEIPTQPTPWRRGEQPRLAGVSAFGFSGTNVHVVLEEAPAPPPTAAPTAPALTPHLFTLSAKTEGALRELAGRYQHYLEQHPDVSLAEVGATARHGRSHFNHRLGLTADSPAAAADLLAAFARGEEAPAGVRYNPLSSQHRPRAVFLFPGQGAQYVGMGLSLYENHSVFRAALDQCAELLSPYLERPLLPIIFGQDAETLNATAYTQPALFAIEYALAQLWRSWGVEPAVVLGHSVGEYVAACVAGVFSLEDGLKLIAARGRLMQALPENGAMAVVFAGQEQVAALIAPYSDQLSIGAINGPTNTVISGLDTAVQAVLEQCQQAGIKTRRLAISHASHSHLMEPMLDEFEAIAATITYAPPRVHLVSNLTGRFVSGEEINAAYWRRHIRQPVRFAESMALLHGRGYQLFLEVGPTPTLLPMGQQCLPEGAGLWLPSLRKGHDDWTQLTQSLAALYVHGYPVDWAAFDGQLLPARQHRRLSLPTYPFQRQRYWLPIKPAAGRFQSQPTSQHPLAMPGLQEHRFESEVSIAALPYLADHQVLGMVVVPATAYVEMALAAAAGSWGQGSYTVSDLTIHEALIVGAEESRPVQLTLTVQGESASFQVMSQTAGDRWQQHASGHLLVEPAATNDSSLSVADVQARCTEELAIEEYYGQFMRRGIAFGPAFRGITRLWRGRGEALGQIEMPGAIAARTSVYHFHPALLDACWQVFAATWEAPDDGKWATYMPVGIDAFRLFQRPAGRLWSYARLRQTGRETQSGDLMVFDESGRLVAEVQGLHVKRATPEALQRALQERPAGELADRPSLLTNGAAQPQDIKFAAPSWQEWLYEVEWRPQPHPQAAVSEGPLPAAPSRTVEQVQPLFTQLEAEHGLGVAAELLPQLEALSVTAVWQALAHLGWPLAPGQRFSVDTLAQASGVVPQQRSLLQRMMQMLAEEGLLRTQGDDWEVVQALAPELPGNLAVQLEELAGRYPIYAAELAVFGRCVTQLAAVLRGEEEPLQLLFPAGAAYTAETLYQDAPTAQVYNALLAEAVAATVATFPAGHKLRVLEIGAGTGGATTYILPRLPAGPCEYTFTDLSKLFLIKAQEKFSDYAFLDYRLLDIERDPGVQGFDGEQFDLIIAANVLHATRDLRQTLAHVRQLLAPAGTVLLLEGTTPRRWVDLTFGLTAGWWKFSDRALRPDHPLLTPAQWQTLMAETGFGEVVAVPETANVALFPQAVIVARNGQSERRQEAGAWLIFSDTQGIGHSLAVLLRQRGEQCLLVTAGGHNERLGRTHWQLKPAAPAAYQQLLREAVETAGGLRGVVHLWSLDMPAEAEAGELDKAQMLATGSALHLVQALAAAPLPRTPRLWLVTRGAQAVGATGAAHPLQAPLWGLGTTLALEHPELQPTRLDLDPTAGPDEQVLTGLLAELWQPTAEEQVAFRDGARYVARLVRRQEQAPAEPSNVTPMRLEVTTPGILDSLQTRPLTRRQPGPGEVEIEVYATGLNFRDVLSAMGVYPGDAGPLGGECTGRVATVGAGVTAFRPGDEVIAIAAGSFGSFVNTRAEFVVRKPAKLSFPEAATVLSAYLTAYYTLHHLAGLSAGERVLIHAAAGGVGLAAVQLAQQAGAEIFTTAGSPEKRAFLRSLGVPHVMNSRTLDFAQEIAQVTEGRGVDVILNSLAGDFVPYSLSVLAENGRFLEIGKRDIWTAEQVAQVKPAAAYFIVDLVAKSAEDPALIQSLLQEIMALLEAGAIRPLPHQIFPLSEAVNAFRTMAQAKHTGKIVVTHPAMPAAASTPGTYLITGGLAGLGLLVAQRLVAEQGARHLMLVSRSSPSVAAQEAIREMEAAGAQILTMQADVSNEAQLRQVLATIEAQMPPLRGVIHSAGVLDDGALLQQDWSRFQKVFAPKVVGGYLLHTLTRHLPLEFFILFSSGSAVLGSAGQSNHAAANAFLDALAHHRRSLGLPALSINWGVWDEIGSAAARHVGERVSSRGIGTISPEEGWQVLAYLRQRPATQVGVFPVNWHAFLAGGGPPFFRELAGQMTQQPAVTLSATKTVVEPAVPTTTLRQRLEAAPASKRRSLLLSHVRDQANKVLGLPATNTIDYQQPLQELGLDSLMAVELRNLLGAGLDLERPLPATLVFDYPTIESLADYLGEQALGWKAQEQPGRADPESERAKQVSELEALSEDEAEALLLAELAALKKK